ncbi:hypothetical protein LPW36_17490 [Jinshanibacter sp. LJY008]|uniref:Uncharacterized protein n=1 Tax=Limnobaculum eriocheiris TaxID=2897391 RepID=A0A9X1SRD4_9GAMM|nr:hypothetical protein [Limnobaculum eriocheiris]MCD1127747.1 hypothetical protein [Limnobaculum eriocheiris]
MHCQDLNKQPKKTLKNKLLFWGSVALIIGGGYIYMSLPEDPRRVSISIELPAETEALPYEVRYRSSICKNKYRDGDFNARYEDDRRYVEVIPKKQGGSNIYKETISVDDGGYCKWKLSNIIIGFQYKKNSSILNNIEENTPVKVKFVFDDYASATSNRQPKEEYNDFIVQKNYYPLKKEFIDNNRKSIVSIKGEQNSLTYQLYIPNEIVYKPILHTNKMVTVIEPANREDKFKIIYPDGTITDVDSAYPLDFEKIINMR